MQKLLSILFVINCFTVNQATCQTICDKLITLLKADQHKNQRGAKEDNWSDIKRLKEISELFNEYGIPYNECDSYLYDAYWLIWVHAGNYKLKRLAFPIIHDLFKNGYVDSSSMTQYYLVSIYAYEYSDFYEVGKEMKVEELYHKLNLDTTSTINIDSMNTVIDKWKKDIKSTKLVSKWKSKDWIKQYEHGDETIDIKINGSVLRIIEMSGKLYYDTVNYKSTPGIPHPIEKIKGTNNYQIVNKDNKSILAIDQNRLSKIIVSDTLAVYYKF